VLGLGNSLSSGGASSEFSILDTSPELWWKFNTGQSAADQDADGDADVLWTDQAGNYNGVGGNTGSGIVDIKEGSFSNGAWLSADDADFLRIGDESLRLTENYTIFIVFTNHNLEDTILGGDTTDFIRFGFTNNASKIRFKHSGTATDFTFDIDPEVGKNLYTITRNGSNEMKISQNSTTALLNATAVNAGAFLAKRGPFGSKGIGDGSLYELVIYNRSVTDAETVLIEADILTRNTLTKD
jgi:hypothetical protein